MTDPILVTLIFLAFIEGQIALILALVAIFRQPLKQPSQMAFHEDTDEEKELKEAAEKVFKSQQAPKSFSELKAQYEEIMRQ